VNVSKTIPAVGLVVCVIWMVWAKALVMGIFAILFLVELRYQSLKEDLS